MMSLFQFKSLFYVPSQQLQGQLQTQQHCVDAGNCITGKEMLEDNSHKASSGNSAAQKLLHMGRERTIISRMAVNSKVV
jgi:hypothetical protein